MVGTQDYYSCHLWSMNMKRSNYLGVTLWMDRVCKYIPYSWWWTTLFCKGQREREWVILKMNTPCCVLGSHQFFTKSSLHLHVLMKGAPAPQLHQPPHKWWRQMNIDLIKILFWLYEDWIRLLKVNACYTADNLNILFGSWFQGFPRHSSTTV